MVHGFLRQITGVTLSTAAVQLCGMSNGRHALVISVDQGTAYVTCNNGDPILTGIAITNSTPLEMRREVYGGMIDRNWFATCSVNTAKITVVETME